MSIEFQNSIALDPFDRKDIGSRPLPEPHVARAHIADAADCERLRRKTQN